MDNKTLFENIVEHPDQWLLDHTLCNEYKRALSVLLKKEHSDPYGFMLEIIETEVHKRLSEKLFEVTQQCADDYKKKK